jgi:hypothetical protein
VNEVLPDVVVDSSRWARLRLAGAANETDWVTREPSGMVGGAHLGRES